MMLRWAVYVAARTVESGNAVKGNSVRERSRQGGQVLQANYLCLVAAVLRGTEVDCAQRSAGTAEQADLRDPVSRLPPVSAWRAP